ncbi:tyrosine-type recombinase/integrase [Streptomyces rapamycinicus]|uniref:Integrase n=2 Tax=Streptomyces rapamycinicus TaxID=1226757 RepID=A0A0A0NA49_STRRN|nr:site-specific integrase [Streptomyces rapamycinicus]AGP56317.1 integrase [Streptomyces rapamycinicus NRRL 5491]MBB4783912.1 integrase [Streptomyces rapamycinicus]RLV80599.1 integrase [Streptomyces rapamycinicus NRRL 5491]UTO64274.1 site-specific integrase [Streptomyces rapamycinicus]UTP32229.1 site-specific integrase [Streptomyces rapamycinicus NRRL 5491]
MAGRKPQRRREFGTVRQLPSGRWQARYWAPDGSRRKAPETFATKTDAQTWLTLTQADIERNHWVDPDVGAVNFEAYALTWVEERGLSATTDELYRRLLRLHILPAFGDMDLDEITPPGVRSWRAERLTATGTTTVAKSYRLLKAIMETAADDELIRRNPCRIKGAGTEKAKERPTATVEQVDALADAVGPRWRLMVYFGAYGPMRPEEQAALRRPDVTLDPLAVRVREAAPELTTGRRAEGDTKSDAGVRTIYLPGFLYIEVKRHLDWFAEKELNGLLFVGEKGAPFRRSSFGRKWRRARAKVGLPEDFRFYDLRHTGHTLSTQSGATLKDTMVRAGQSSEKAALIYQHSDEGRQQEVAEGIDARVRAARGKALSQPPQAREA